MRMYDLIERKKSGAALTDAEIAWMIRGYTAGEIPDEQMAAFCMAVCFRGMTAGETASLTMAMAHSGDTVDLSAFGKLSADKHSTGGVGDKTTLLVAPLVAAAGGKMAKMSGRGLGHTGGTVDKLESFPGYRSSLDPAAFLAQTAAVGICVTGQSADFDPADRKLYALRDVTATVNSLPLIASSIMSKKLAAGAQHIVLDVKVGSGAFLKTLPEAEALAREMVLLGRACGRNTAAILTDMDVPLGRAVGNILEVREALAVLRGSRAAADLREVSLALASRLIAMCLELDAETASRRARELLDSGAAFRKFREWIAAQGGDATFCDHPERFPKAACSRRVRAAQDGFLTHTDAAAIGRAGVLLGAGRAVKTDSIDRTAGILLQKKTGSAVRFGDTLAILYARSEALLDTGEEALRSALTFGAAPPQPRPLLLGSF